MMERQRWMALSKGVTGWHLMAIFYDEDDARRFAEWQMAYRTVCIEEIGPNISESDLKERGYL